MIEINADSHSYFFLGAVSTWIYFIIGGVTILVILLAIIVTIRGRHHCSERRLGPALARQTHLSIAINCITDSEDDGQEFQWDDNDLRSRRSARTLTSTTYVSNGEQIPMAEVGVRSEETTAKSLVAQVDVHSAGEMSAAATSASAIASTTASRMTKCDVEAPAEASSELACEAALALDGKAVSEGAEGAEGGGSYPAVRV